jgi:hypothetical protein
MIKNLEQQQMQSKKKIAIIFRGESYRNASKENGQNSREIGTKNTINGQKLANMNHCNFLQYIKKKHHIDIDVFIDTQTTKYDLSLITDYKKRKIPIKNFAFHNEYCKTQMLSIQRSINHVICNDLYENYESVLILRNDLILKDCFFDLYNPFEEKIKFSFIIWAYNKNMKKKDMGYRGRTLGGYPRVGDIMYYIPKRYFLLLNHFKSIDVPGGWGHEAIYFWNEIIPNFEYDFYIKTFHESNPAVDLNPLYHMVNRKIASEYITRQDKIYPDNWDEYF